MLAIAVDGRVVGDVVAAGGARPTVYRVALGRLAGGTHSVSIALDRARSAPAVRQARAGKLRIALAPPADRVAQYAPILYGRDLPEIPGRFENNHTDAPLLAYHTRPRDAAGHTTIEYTVIWSNEDDGHRRARADGALGPQHRHRVDLPRDARSSRAQAV